MVILQCYIFQVISDVIYWLPIFSCIASLYYSLDLNALQKITTKNFQVNILNMEVF